MFHALMSGGRQIRFFVHDDDFSGWLRNLDRLRLDQIKSDKIRYRSDYQDIALTPLCQLEPPNGHGETVSYNICH